MTKIDYINAHNGGIKMYAGFDNFVGWGRGIKWSPYRRALMNHLNVYDVRGENPKYVWKE